MKKARAEREERQRELVAASPPLRAVLDAFHDECHRRSRTETTDADMIVIVSDEQAHAARLEELGREQWAPVVLHDRRGDEFTLLRPERWDADLGGQRAAISGLCAAAATADRDACALAWLALYSRSEARRGRQLLYYELKDVWPSIRERIDTGEMPRERWEELWYEFDKCVHAEVERMSLARQEQRIILPADRWRSPVVERYAERGFRFLRHPMSAYEPIFNERLQPFFGWHHSMSDVMPWNVEPTAWLDWAGSRPQDFARFVVAERQHARALLGDQRFLMRERDANWAKERWNEFAAEHIPRRS